MIKSHNLPCPGRAEWQIPREIVSPSKEVNQALNAPDISNSFSAINPPWVPMSKGHMASEEEDNEKIEDLSNDPLKA